MANRNKKHDDSTPLDLVALSLAIWLALLTCVVGLSRLHLPLPYAGESNDQFTAPNPTDAYSTALAFGT
jgi:hypothetical protein